MHVNIYAHDCACKVKTRFEGVYCKKCLLDGYHGIQKGNLFGGGIKFSCELNVSVLVVDMAEEVVKLINSSSPKEKNVINEATEN